MIEVRMNFRNTLSINNEGRLQIGGADVLTLAKQQYKGKVGIIKVRMLKPFDEKNFIAKSQRNTSFTLIKGLSIGVTDRIVKFRF